MSMKYIRSAYGVPAKRGRRIEAYFLRSGVWTLAAEGRITSASHHIHVNGRPYHPTWGIVYLNDDGSVLKDCRDPVPDAAKGEG